MKRHERPYGCTFLTCNKTFGSKNDWKRHENSQHFHLETWRCDEERLEGGVCAKVCYRREIFKEHLAKVHEICDDDTAKTKFGSCRIGRNCQSRFWCGFCNKLLELQKRGVDAWTERFDHIDDHFMGRGQPKQNIQEWIPMDSDKPKGEVGSPQSVGSWEEYGTSDPATGSPAGKPLKFQDSAGESPGYSTSYEKASANVDLKRGKSSSGDDNNIQPKVKLESHHTFGFASEESLAYAEFSFSEDYASQKREKPTASPGIANFKSQEAYLKAGSRVDKIIYCCQCLSPSNLKASLWCTNCISTPGHEFCCNCEVEAVLPQDNHNTDLAAQSFVDPKLGLYKHNSRLPSNDSNGVLSDCAKTEGNLIKLEPNENAPSTSPAEDSKTPSIEHNLVEFTAASKLQAATNIKRETPVHEGADILDVGKDEQNSNLPFEDTATKKSPLYKDDTDTKEKIKEGVEASSTIHKKAKIQLQGGEASSNPTTLPVDTSLVSKNCEGGFISGVYERCSSILVAAVVAMKLKPEIIDPKAVKMLISSSESLFLWGESFKTSDLDFLIEWSCDLKEAIGQYFIDISQNIIHSLAPRLSDSEEDAIQVRVSSLLEFILPGVGWDLDEGSLIQEEEEEDISESEDEEETEDDGLDLARDIDTSVKCLMDLIPSMEQVIRQREMDK